jgi:hypothetical protein
MSYVIKGLKLIKKLLMVDKDTTVQPIDLLFGKISSPLAKPHSVSLLLALILQSLCCQI